MFVHLFSSRSTLAPRVFTLLMAGAAAIPLGFGGPANAKAKYTTFQIQNGETEIAAINAAGDSTGYFIDSGNAVHGFVRSTAGTITTFQVSNENTDSTGIDAAGDVTGWYGAGDVFTGQGFVRSADGTVTTFDAGKDASATVPQGMSSDGAVTGYWLDQSGNEHGFVRAVDGTLTSFDVTGEAAAEGNSIGGNGATAGMAFTTSGIPEGFLRKPGGKLITFTEGNNITGALSINARGLIAGYYEDAFAVFHGVVRATNGTLTTFEAPGAGTGEFDGTFGYAINGKGTITGRFVDSSGVEHGYVRSPAGTIADFDAPGAKQGFRFGTFPLAINDSNVVVGYYTDTSGVPNAFIRSP